jgi:predicted dithiol-disulfide oxidoreductase (DUF899 family)
MTTNNIENPRVVSRDEWLQERLALLEEEKQLTRARDAISAKRRALPWVKVEKEYLFDTPEGKKSLSDLFAGRSQLFVYHFMWRKEFGEGCVGCSYLADHVDGANMHLQNHDVTWVAISRAPLADLQAFKARMGWKFPWVSSLHTDFNFDYHVSFTPEQLASGEVYYNYRNTKASIEELSGQSVFYKNAAGEIFHTYSCYGRGNEEVLGAYMYLDMTPKGRDENGPHFSLADWVRHHDRYASGGHVDVTGAYIAPKNEKSCCH